MEHNLFGALLFSALWGNILGLSFLYFQRSRFNARAQTQQEDKFVKNGSTAAFVLIISNSLCGVAESIKN